jgi:hypothetical protein
LPGQITWNGGNLVQQLAIKQEILAERFICHQAVAGNHFSQRREGRSHAV